MSTSPPVNPDTLVAAAGGGVDVLPNSGVSVPSLTCNQCNQTFRRPSVFTRHQRTCKTTAGSEEVEEPSEGTDNSEEEQTNQTKRRVRRSRNNNKRASKGSYGDWSELKRTWDDLVILCSLN